MNRRRMMMRRAGATPVLPAEYQRVEWIYSTSSIGNAFISTTFVPHLSNEIYLKFSPDSVRNIYTPLSAGVGNYQFLAVIQGNGTTYIRAFSNASVGYTVGYSAGNDLELRFYQDGTVYKTTFKNLTYATEHTYTNSVIAELDGNQTNVYLFRRRNNETVYGGKIYEFWAKDSNGNFVANYVPCYRKRDGIIGMYDTVSRAFFTSANSGTFQKGADV